MAEIEVERRVDFRIIELHQHVVAGHADMRGAEGHEGRDIEIAHPDDVQSRHVGLETELAGFRIVEGSLDLDTGPVEQRDHLVEDAPLGQSEDKGFVATDHDCYSRSPDFHGTRRRRASFMMEIAVFPSDFNDRAV